jgi:hypothetical protein
VTLFASATPRRRPSSYPALRRRFASRKSPTQPYTVMQLEGRSASAPATDIAHFIPISFTSRRSQLNAISDHASWPA